MSGLSLFTLGNFQALLNEQTIVGFESCKVRALLAYLVLEAQKLHSRSHLASIFWPDIPESVAFADLRHALANLRHVLGEHTSSSHFIESDRNNIWWNRSCDYYSDVAEFINLVKDNSNGSTSIDRLEYAINLYRGEFLEGLDIPHCAGFEEWVLFKRADYGLFLRSAFECQYEEYVLQSRYLDAIRCAKQLIRREPWDELSHEKLMRAFVLAGHRGDALLQYAECQRVLRTELGIEPGHSITALYECIRDGTISNIK